CAAPVIYTGTRRGSAILERFAKQGGDKMARVKIRTPEEMTEEQRRVYNATLAGRRGRMPAPLVAWLESPVLADRAQKLGEFVRYETSLPARLSELAILTVARYWTAQFEWT